MPKNPIFSENEIKEAKNRLITWSNRDATKVIQFYNSLQAFLREVEETRGSKKNARLLAIDTTEVMSFAAKSKSHRSAFSFGDLFSSEQTPDDQSVNARFDSLDSLIGHHLLFGSKTGHIILEPHADEILSLENLNRDKVSDILVNMQTVLDRGNIRTLSIEQLKSIQDWVESSSFDSQPKEFQVFRDTFLPGWRSELVALLESKVRQRNRIRYFLRNGVYAFIAPYSAGERSIHSALAKQGIEFDWQNFEKFMNRERSSRIVREIDQVFLSLAESLHGKLSSGGIRIINNDARAFAIMHLLNSFLAKKKQNLRIEFVTRSRALHDIIGSLPEGKLKLSVRHPLLIPEIYDFDKGALETLSKVIQTLDGAISPIIDAYQQNELTHPKHDAELIEKTQKPARELVEVLSDSIAVQQTLEVSDDSSSGVEEVFHFSQNAETAAGSNEKDKRLTDEITRTFELIAKLLSKNNDPFSKAAIFEIGARNKDLIGFEKVHTFPEGAKARVRLLELKGKDSPWPLEFSVVRFLDGSFSRLFHLYSTRVQEFIGSSKKLEVTEYTPNESELSISELLDAAEEAFEQLSLLGTSRVLDIPKDTDQNDLVFNMEMTLLCCIAFANQGKHQTAATLASTILTNVMSQIRAVGQGPGGSDPVFPGAFTRDPRTLLACKELFLLRHFCERAISTSQFNEKKLTLRAIKGDAVRNLARAQRDLDSAVLMNEKAGEALLDELDDKIGNALRAPTGLSTFEDPRLPLVHFSGWIDQLLTNHFVSNIQHGQEIWTEKEQSARIVRNRFDLWTAAGLAKEAEVLCWRTRMLAESSTNSDVRRYYFHLEARSYQNLLSLFSVFLATDISPDIQTFWDRDVSPANDRLFVFRRWNTWYERFNKLRNDFSFEMRMGSFFECIFTPLERLEKVKSSISNERYSQIIHETVSEIDIVLTKSKLQPNSFLTNLGLEMKCKLESLA